MGFGGAKGTAPSTHVDGTKRWWSCPRCGEQNPGDAIRCRDCLTPLAPPVTSVPPKEAAVLPSEIAPARKPKTVRPKPTPPPQPVKLVRRRVIRKKIAAPSRPLSRLDALRRVLDSFSRPKDPTKGVQLQCPVCDRVVDETVAVCECGAIFEDATGTPWGYECPVCGRKVASDSVQCRCGARFAN